MLYLIKALNLLKIGYLIFTAIFLISCASVKVPSIEVEEEDNYSFIKMENNVLNGSLVDLDEDKYYKLELNIWMYKYHNGKIKYYLFVSHQTEDALYSQDQKSLNLIVDGENMFWNAPDNLSESYLYKTNLSTGTKKIIHYYGVNLYLLSFEKIKKIAFANIVKVSSIGKMKRTNWSFGVRNFNIFKQFYNNHIKKL